MGIQVKIKGVDTLQARLERLKNVDPALIAAINQSTALVSRRAKGRCPVDTGALRASIHTKPADTEDGGKTITGVVYTAKEYAMYVEFGTGKRGNGSYPYEIQNGPLAYKADWPGQIAQPFMMPALLESKSEIHQIVHQAVQKAVLRKKG